MEQLRGFFYLPDMNIDELVIYTPYSDDTIITEAALAKVKVIHPDGKVDLEIVSAIGAGQKRQFVPQDTDREGLYNSFISMSQGENTATVLSLDFNGQDLGQPAVMAIVQALVASGLTNGSLDIAGGTNYWGSDVEVYIAILRDRDWTVVDND